MAIYAIGDIQGCYDEFRALLELIKFNPERDRLWLVGDIVNRGPQSLAVLRFLKGLGEPVVNVLGNHDLHLLAVSQGNLEFHRDDTFHDILEASDGVELLEWLRHRPLMHHDAESGFSLLHGGLPPQWDIPTALERAHEVETALRGEGFHAFCQQMYGDKPQRWSEDLSGMDRLRFITNCLTRLRYCDPAGNLAMNEKGPPGTQPAPYLPWFLIPGRASRQGRIICGHWSTLGFHNSLNVWSLDTGCLWGGQLTALKITKKGLRLYQVTCPGALKPSGY